MYQSIANFSKEPNLQNLIWIKTETNKIIL